MRARTSRKRFWMPGGFYATERVARDCDSEYADQPAIPSDCKGLFLFRVDADVYHEEGHHMIRELTKKYGIKTTWFINSAGYLDSEAAIEKLAKDASIEIQPHGYQHEVFKSLEENVRNLQKAEDFLGKYVKGEVRGAVAPYGHWNEYFQKALEKLNYHYSSEFSLSYGRTPFYPEIEGRASSVLQIPIHPVCSGSFISSGIPCLAACDHFEKYIRSRYSQRLPIILYGHPNDRDVNYNRQVLDSIFKTIASLSGILDLNFRDYYLWWTNGRTQENNAEYIPVQIKVKTVAAYRYTLIDRIRNVLKCLLAEIRARLLFDLLDPKQRGVLIGLKDRLVKGGGR